MLEDGVTEKHFHSRRSEEPLQNEPLRSLRKRIMNHLLFMTLVQTSVTVDADTAPENWKNLPKSVSLPGPRF